MSDDKKIKIGQYTLDIPNWDKILFPQQALKKSDLIGYYNKIADYLLPFLKNHVVTLHRFPDGIKKEGFYQKKYQKYYPKFLKSQGVKLREGGMQQQVVCNKKADLIYLAGQAAIAFHTWLSPVQSLHKPTRILFDLDPPNKVKDFKQLIKAAREIKKILDKLDLLPYVMTTGSRGLHVVVPIKPTKDFDAVRQFARNVAKCLTEKHPQDFTIELRKDKRRGRIFIDYTRNAYGQTSIVPYSLRALDKAPIATPLAWEELAALESAQAYTIDNIFKRLAKINDPWKAFHNKPVTLKQEAIQKVAD